MVSFSFLLDPIALSHVLVPGTLSHHQCIHTRIHTRVYGHNHNRAPTARGKKALDFRPYTILVSCTMTINLGPDHISGVLA